MRGTGQCNGGVVEDYRESDIPHHYKNTGMFTHEYYDDNYSTALFFQMHGMSERSDTSIRAIVSDGTDYDSSDTGSIANDLRTALDSQLPSGYVAKSCQGTTLGSSDRLCGTDNLWGRYTNGGTHSNACTTSQSTSSDRFLHVEQTWDLQSPPTTSTSVDYTDMLKAIGSITSCLSQGGDTGDWTGSCGASSNTEQTGLSCP